MQKLSMGISEWLLLITLSVLWGGSFFLIKIALKDLPPLTVVLYRVSLAAIALTIFVFISRKRMPASLSLWREFLVMGALNNLIPFSFGDKPKLTVASLRFSTQQHLYSQFC
jgi:drug/metabolite transporter (DMT)-like permease